VNLVWARPRGEDGVGVLLDIEADFPLTPTAEVHTRSDRMTLAYRKRTAADLVVALANPLTDPTWHRPALLVTSDALGSTHHR
jgi:hypothetical protein